MELIYFQIYIAPYISKIKWEGTRRVNRFLLLLRIQRTLWGGGGTRGVFRFLLLLRFLGNPRILESVFCNWRCGKSETANCATTRPCMVYKGFPPYSVILGGVSPLLYEVQPFSWVQPFLRENRGSRP